MKRSDTILEELEKIQETFVENIFTHSDFGTHVKEENKSNLIIEKLYIIDWRMKKCTRKSRKDYILITQNKKDKKARSNPNKTHYKFIRKTKNNYSYTKRIIIELNNSFKKIIFWFLFKILSTSIIILTNIQWKTKMKAWTFFYILLNTTKD